MIKKSNRPKKQSYFFCVHFPLFIILRHPLHNTDTDLTKKIRKYLEKKHKQKKYICAQRKQNNNKKIK